MSPRTPKRGLRELIEAQREEPAPENVTALTPTPAIVARHAADRVQERTLQPVPAAKPARRPGRRRKQPPPADALARVMQFHDSALTRPGEWEPVSLRVPLDVAQQLKMWVIAERARTGRRTVSMNHVVAAACTMIPASISDAMELGIAWQAVHGVGKVPSRGSGTRLPSDLAARLSSLTDRLQAMDVRVRAWQVHAQAIVNELALLNGREEG
jgi:hypothetical protein